MTIETRTGQCLCGAVTFEADLNGPHFHACHCARCRQWGGGPAFATPAQAIRMTGEENVVAFSSSKHGNRHFCRQCGTHLYWRSKTGSGLAVWLGAIDGHEDMTFGSQIYIDRKPGNYGFADRTGNLTGDQVVALFRAGVP